jgi:hypothetical protein
MALSCWRWRGCLVHRLTRLRHFVSTMNNATWSRQTHLQATSAADPVRKPAPRYIPGIEDTGQGAAARSLPSVPSCHGGLGLQAGTAKPGIHPQYGSLGRLPAPQGPQLPATTRCDAANSVCNGYVYFLRSLPHCFPEIEHKPPEIFPPQAQIFKDHAPFESKYLSIRLEHIVHTSQHSGFSTP